MKLLALVATLFAVAAPSKTVQLAIVHTVRGCHIWQPSHGQAPATALKLKHGDKVTLRVRPEHFEAAAPGQAANVIATTVTFVESLGSTTHAYCDYPGAAETLVCELDGATRLKNGAALSLAIPAARTYLFDAEGKAFRRHLVEAQQEAA